MNREAFEAWHKKKMSNIHGACYSVDELSRYVDSDVQIAWRGYRAGLASQAQQSQWMPIETAPRDGTVIIVWDGYTGFGSTVGAAYWSKEVLYREDLCILDEPAGWRWSSDNSKNGMARATHWMPLPPAPEGGE